MVNAARIKIKYFNKSLQIGMVNWRKVYLLKPTPLRINIKVAQAGWFTVPGVQQKGSTIKH